MAFAPNYLAVLVAAVVSFVLGAIWHGPIFGKTWGAAMSLTPEQIAEGRKEMPRFMIVVFITLVVVAWGLGVVAAYLHLLSWMQGLKLGVLAWFAFALPVSVLDVMMNRGKRMTLLGIGAGSWLVSFVVSGIIVSVWH